MTLLLHCGAAVSLLVVLALTIVEPATAKGMHAHTPRPAGVLHFSDFHYDPLFATEDAIGPCTAASTSAYGLPGCDSSLAMIRSALGDAAAVVRRRGGPHVIVYTGDWMRHKMASLPNDTAAGVHIATTLAAELVHAFGNASQSDNTVIHLTHPNIPIALGNNDFIPDYHFEVASAGKNDLLNRLAAAFNAEGLMGLAEAEQFRYCGFYRRDVNVSALPPLRVLNLNSLIWSLKMYPKTNETDPCGQFAWMERELADAERNNVMVYVQSHIPPGVPFWDELHYNQYKQLLLRYNSVVKAQFYGHIHRWSFSAMSSKNDVAPLFIGGPITRKSKTTPDFAIMDVNDSWVVEDVLQRYLDPATDHWVDGLRVKEALQLPDLSTASLYALASSMMNSKNASSVALFDNYWRIYNGGAPIKNTCTAEFLCQKAIACLLRAFTVGEAIECALTPEQMEHHLRL